MNGNFLYQGEAEALQLYLSQLLDRRQLEPAAEVLLSLAELSEDEARRGLDEVTRTGQLDPLLQAIGQGDGWMRLARLSVLQNLRQLARPRGQEPTPLWSDQPRAELFGSLRLTFRCHSLSAERWPSQKALRLFACLVARQGAPLRCAAAIEMLWPEQCPGRGRSSLRNCIYQVRYALRDLLGMPGEGVLRCRRQDTLTLETYWETDVQDFERAADQARRSRCAESARRADTLYRGTLLEGLDDLWIQPDRTRLAALRAQNLHVLCTAQLSSGQLQASEQTARAALQHDDLHEQAWSDLLAALIAQGRESEARRLYREAVAHFQTELGFRPEALGDAYDRLLAPTAFLKVS